MRPRITELRGGGRDGWEHRWRFQVTLPDGHEFVAVITTLAGSALVVDRQAEHGHDNFCAGSTGYPDVDELLDERVRGIVDRIAVTGDFHRAGAARRARQRTTQRRFEQHRRAA